MRIQKKKEYSYSIAHIACLLFRVLMCLCTVHGLMSEVEEKRKTICDHRTTEQEMLLERKKQI